MATRAILREIISTEKPFATSVAKNGHVVSACHGGGKSKPQTNYLTSVKSKDLASDADLIQTVHQVGGWHLSQYKVTLQLNSLPVEMKIDTGAAVSIISKATHLCFLRPT